jgi:CubicO group peptidase (beta-lactamase class C family)
MKNTKTLSRPFLFVNKTVIYCLILLVLAQSSYGEDLQSRIGQLLENKTTYPNSPVGVLVVRGNQVLARRDYNPQGQDASGRTGKRGSAFPIATVNEQFVAAAILHLEELGKLKLNDPVCNYLKECPSTWKEMRVVHLLTHTSGLPSLRSAGTKRKVRAYESLRDILRNVPDVTLISKPGSVLCYNELDFVLLRGIIKSISLMPAQEYIAKNVFLPLRMMRTRYSAKENLVSTIEDLYRWNSALIKEIIISPESLSEMFTPYRDGSGLGWKIVKEFDRRAAVQSGRSGQTSVCIRFYPDDQAFVVVIASGADSCPLAHSIAQILFEQDPADSR